MEPAFRYEMGFIWEKEYALQKYHNMLSFMQILMNVKENFTKAGFM